MHSATAMFVLLGAIVACLGSATPVLLEPHTVFATPAHTPLLHLGSSYSLQVPFAAPAQTGIFPAKASGPLLYFSEGAHHDTTAQQSSQYSLEDTRYRSGGEQASPGHPINYARTSQELQTTASPSAFASETRVPSQDFNTSPQRQNYPSSRTFLNNQSSVQEYPVEDRRAQLTYSARQNFQNVQDGHRVQQQEQQAYPEAQGYSRGPVSQGYPEGRRVSEEFPASPYPESQRTPVYSATPAPVAYSSHAAAAALTSPGYAARPITRTFQETSPVQEYPVSTAVQGYSPNPIPQAHSQQTVVPQSYSRTSVPQGYTGEQFQEDVAARQSFPNEQAPEVSHGYPISSQDLHHPQPQQTYSVNFEGSGFGYGYTVQRQQLTTPTPPLYGHVSK